MRLLPDKKRIVLAMILTVGGIIANSTGLEEMLRIRSIQTGNGLPTDNIQQVLQDKEGYLWIAMRNGVARYDGNSIKIIKSGIRDGNVLTDNTVNCIEEDDCDRIWIGTPNGLNVFDKRSSTTSKFPHTELKGNPIADILYVGKGKLLLATDLGLYEYFIEKDSLSVVTRAKSGDIMPQTAIKSLIRDSRSNIWIGTWNEGIYRIDTHGKYHYYPRINDGKSAHVIFEDSHHRIWVGTWGYGLSLLKNPYTESKSSWQHFRHVKGDSNSLSNNIIYSLSEDPSTGNIWVGTSHGLSILDDKTGKFTNHFKDRDGNRISEVTSIISDRSGLMWLGTLGYGAMAFVTADGSIMTDMLETVKERYGTNSVDRILVDHNGKIWLSLKFHSGLCIYNPQDKTVTANHDYPFSSGVESPYEVISMLERKNGDIYIGTYDHGLYIISDYGKSITNYHTGQTPWISGDRVSEIYEDNRGWLWFGGRPGLSVLKPDDRYCKFDSKRYEQLIVSNIIQTPDGSIWVSTQNKGILRIEGDGDKISDFSIRQYTSIDGTVNSDRISTIFSDSSGRIWAGSEDCGLSLYDYKTDRFEGVQLSWDLPGDNIAGIEEDKDGNLWISSNIGIYQLKVSSDSKNAEFKIYTSDNGAQNDYYNNNATFRDNDGKLYFGGSRGIDIISASPQIRKNLDIPVTITDIRIDGIPWEKLSEKERDIVSTESPQYTQSIYLSPEHNKFSIEFAYLDYLCHPLQQRYMYMLEGYDNEWQYLDQGNHIAQYSNVPPGTYTFRVKSNGVNGEWLDNERTLKIKIAPPLWLRWWAILLYAVTTLCVVYAAICYSRRRMRDRNEIQLQENRLKQAEEMNKEKMHYFTNVTHEWLTPLSIISAVADEIRKKSPETEELNRSMMTSVTRLSRLLRQVLEFRKVETGNLMLRVAESDIVAGTREIVRSILPLAKSRGMNISLITDRDSIHGWYDGDKLDKILYNLLSNACKYSRSGDNIEIRLEYDDSSKTITITVTDHGEGIPENMRPHIFERFYTENSNTNLSKGNGIGLSLAKDLVDAHHGHISFKSEIGKGTEFRIVLPLGREAYTDIETESESATMLHKDDRQASHSAPKISEDDADNAISILIVEDDPDMMRVMKSLMSDLYHIFTASNGEEALVLLKDRDINLVITDMAMPVMGGLELCHRIKEDMETSHIPILMLTANNMEEAEIASYEAGADAFVSKPFNISVLIARINNLLRTRANVRDEWRSRQNPDNNSLPSFSQLDDQFIKRAMDKIMDHLSDANYSQTDFANDMGMAKSTIFRKLKTLTGMSYVSFTRNIRLKAACKIMRENPGIRISELAYRVGYNDPKYFSMCFKKEFGMLPTEFLDNTRSKEKL